MSARAIEHAATIFALEMLRERTGYELESRLKGDLLRDLFSGSYADERDEALGPLQRYDAEHGTDLVHTLRAYVDADHNAAEAARRLHGADPSRGDLRLQTELALELQDLTRLYSTT